MALCIVDTLSMAHLSTLPGLPQWDTVDAEIKIPFWEPRADK